MSIKYILKLSFALTISILLTSSLNAKGDVIERTANDTVTPIEMNIGDTLQFTLRNGDVRTMVLKETAADVIITNLSELKVDQPGGALLFHFTAEIEIDGHPMKLERYVGSQESFYEPYVINGLRIWFDAVKNISEVLRDDHGTSGVRNIPFKDARFAIKDMTDSVAPVDIKPWYENNDNFISISDSYRADDPWMGPYNGTEIHGGMDINFPPGTPNFTPIPIDDHYFFNSLAEGHNNNRWRGIRKWENGDIWTIQNHHMINLRVPEHTSLESGVHYADAAGVWSGAVHHAHYVFRVQTPKDDYEILIDPWILFWQAFEDNKKRSGEIKASIAPFKPHNTGEAVRFNSDGSRHGVIGSELSYYWTFGNGGWSSEANPEYTYTKPGIYPVTLTVDDGAQRTYFTQHITIDGEKIGEPVLTLRAEGEPSFRNRPIHAMDVYGIPINFIPHTLPFVARETRPVPNGKKVLLNNSGGGILPDANPPLITYYDDKDWLSAKLLGEGNEQEIKVSADATGLPTGVYHAKITVELPGVVNGEQQFLVKLTIPTHPPSHRSTGNVRDGLQYEVIHHSDIRYKRFYSTPYFWVGPQFHRWEEKGYGEYYLTNGGRSREGEFARFTPDLEEGKYEVSFASETPFNPKQRAISGGEQYAVNPELNPDPRFAVRVHSKEGDQIIWVEPIESKVIGTFEFHEGMDGFVEILAEGSTGQVLIDAIIFKQLQ